MNTLSTHDNSQAAYTPLVKGNDALRRGNYAQAIEYYAQVIVQQPMLAKSISANLAIARQKYRGNRHASEKPCVAVCGWELAHNAAGRVHTLATIYDTFSQVEIIGSLFPKFGREVWEPIRDTAIAKHTIIVEDESKFIAQAIQLVAAHPYDIVHLSKPRAPNIFFGILYKLLWNAQILVDIDDEELAFVDTETPISIHDYIQQHGKLPELNNLDGQNWTRLAVGLAKEFDAVTVCNAALQERYGGEIIHHARDENQFKPSPQLKQKSREMYGISQDAKVVLFFGTPREHKGLIETAQAIASLKRSDIIYCIVGTFPDESLKKRLLEIKGCNYTFLPNQPISKAPNILAIADCCVFLQSPDSIAAQFQTPAKLSDALGMDIPIISYESYGLQELIKANAILKTNKKSLKSDLEKTLLRKADIQSSHSKIRNFFKENYSIKNNAERLRSLTCGFQAIRKDHVELDAISSQFLSIALSSVLQNFKNTAPKKLNKTKPTRTSPPKKPKTIQNNKLKMNSKSLITKIFGHNLSDDTLKPSTHIDLPYFSVLVYAEKIDTQLRLTLESLALATANLNCSISEIGRAHV